jgi:ParB family chromosome partitioning protein
VGFPVIAMIDATAGETIDLVRKMYSENEDRENLSPHETGMMFKHWLDAEIFPTQEAIAAETGQSKQNIGKYIGLASLPDHVLKAFRDPRVISLRWSSELANACDSRAIEIQALAEDLAKRTPAPAPEAVFAALLAGAAPKTKKSAGARASESIKEGNKVLFELSAREGRYGIRLGKHVDKRLRKDLQHDLKQWLHTWLKERAAGAGK